MLKLRRLQKNTIATEKITSFAMQVPKDQVIERVQEIVEEHLRQEITGYEMIQKLDESFFEGGAGLNRRTAERIGHTVEHLLANADTLKRIETLPKEKSSPAISYIASSLLDTLQIDIRTTEKERMEVKRKIYSAS